MDDFMMGQQSFLFSPSSDGGEYPECGLIFPQSDESGCPKTRKLIAEQLIHNKYLKKPEEKCMSQ